MAFNDKRIADTVHGTIGLSKLETQLINTQAFQRLRNVKQLGLAYYVFPTADYSRFAHSLGVCHITGRTLSALKTNGAKVNQAEMQTYRLAALLHDIGHYPFSHTMEDAIKNHYASSHLMPKVGNRKQEKSLKNGSPTGSSTFFGHERARKEVLIEDNEINTVLSKSGIDPLSIYSIFMREEPPLFANLISSDLDADRIDYLLRTAHHSGLPYGAIDLEYILSQMRLDSNNRICLTSKALGAADHFLLSRYFDYQLVAFHKSVVAFELTLKDVIGELLRSGRMACSADDVTTMIRTNEWHAFDDREIVRLIKEELQETQNEAWTLKAETILKRRPPALLADIAHVGPREEAKLFRAQRRLAKDQISKWANEFDIPEPLWFVSDPAPMVLTKIGSHVPVTALDTKGDDQDKYEQEIWIQDERGQEAKPIVSLTQSLMHVLSQYALFSWRIFVVLPPDKVRQRGSIARRVRESLVELEIL